MDLIQTIVGLHGLYFLYMGFRYLHSFLSTKDFIYFFPSMIISLGVILFFSARKLNDKKIYSYYSIIVSYSILIIARTYNGIKYLISKPPDSAIFIVGLIVGNALMAVMCCYVNKEKNRVIEEKQDNG